MPPSPPIRLVCFDWGGVIIRICRSWDEGCAAAGIPVRGDVASPECRARRKVLSNDYQLGKFDDATFLARLSETTGGLYTPEEIARVHDAWLIAEYPGVADLVDRLTRLTHVQTGVLSNTNARHWARHTPRSDNAAADFPTIAKLRYRHASHLLGLGKPDPAIYHEYARLTGFAPAEILFFDDLEENVQAARGAGWQCEQIDHTGDTAAQIDAHLRSHQVW
jgi:putative hydrolase of the HAD superfamily